MRQTFRIPGVAVRLLAGGVWLGAVLLAWSRPYSLDYETTLLPWLVSRGWVLYRDIADQHPPLFPVLLALLTGGGDPGVPLHLFIVALFALTLALTYAAAARLAGPGAGLAALVLTALWFMAFDGTHLWYDTALAPIYLASLIWLDHVVHHGDTETRTPDRELWLALAMGGLLGAGVLVKQHALLAVLVVFLAAAVAGGLARVRRLIGLAVGLGVVVLGVGGWLIAQGALAPAWFWVVAFSLDGRYAQAAAQAPVAAEWPRLYALYALAPAALLAWWAAEAAPGHPRRAGILILLAWTGLLLAATLPAWPRYGEIHLHAAIPLLAVGGGVAFLRAAITLVSSQLGFKARESSPAPRRGAGRVRGESRPTHPARIGDVPASPQPSPQGAEGAGSPSQRTPYTLLQWASSLVTLGFLVWSGIGAGLGGVEALRIQALVGPPVVPYAVSAPPLRAWVDAHAPPGTPIVVQDLDAMLYRVLEREPPRPWTPQLPWMLAAQDGEARWWAAVAQARAPVALVPAGAWDQAAQPGTGSAEARLRADYHEAARFALASYPGAPAVPVVALLRNDNALH